MQDYILVLYDSRHGSVKNLANQVGLGIEKQHLNARLRTVPRVSAVSEQTEDEIPENGDIYANLDDLKNCMGLVLGSPTHFGNMSASLKYFWDSTTPLWMSGRLIGKPAGVFTASASYHGGQESTLLSMMIPLLHHGMLITGLPYSHTQLSTTQTGGSPYGATHVSGINQQANLSADEKQLAFALGERIAILARQLGQKNQDVTIHPL